MVATDAVPVDHRYLRSAIEFAVAIAAAGQRTRPPIAFPAELKPFLRQSRVPTSALGKLRRAIEADAGFRRRLAAGAVPELVDDIGREWLRREDGWRERVAELVARAEADSDAAADEAAARRAEKRREAAEQAALRSRAEVAALRERLDLMEAQVAAERASAAAATADAVAARAESADARLAARHANDRADAARARLEAVDAELEAARRRAAAAEAQRDGLLADRAERSGVEVTGAQVGELRELARSARGLADRLADLVQAPAAGRVPLSLPGGVARDSRRATEFLLKVPGALVLLDGYNVAKLGWPSEELTVQRARCTDLASDVARRLGTDVTVVFDGAAVVGAHATRRLPVRVAYSPPGVTADDVIRATVAATPADRPVVVVTNDQAVRRDVQAAGANVVSSDAFLALR